MIIQEIWISSSWFFWKSWRDFQVIEFKKCKTVNFWFTDMTVYEKWKRRIEEVSRNIRHVSQMYVINKKSIEIWKLKLCSAEFLYILSCWMNYVIAVVWIAVCIDRDYAKMNRYVWECLKMSEDAQKWL